MNTSPDRSDTVRLGVSLCNKENSCKPSQKCREMISELRRSAFDTDLLIPAQSYQDLNSKLSTVPTNESSTSSTINPRRVEALQRDYERLGFQVERSVNPIAQFH